MNPRFRGRFSFKTSLQRATFKDTVRISGGEAGFDPFPSFKTSLQRVSAFWILASEGCPLLNPRFRGSDFKDIVRISGGEGGFCPRTTIFQAIFHPLVLFSMVKR